MNKLLLMVVLSACVVPAVNAQTSGVTTSTDPAKIAAIESHAKALKASQPAHMSGMPMHHKAKADVHHPATKKTPK